MDIKLNNLIRRIATNDDEHAFRGLYYLYYDSLFRFAIHIVKREDWCEEIISDVFFHLWQNRAKLIDVLNLDSYIFRAVKNQALNFLEKEDKFV
jgi:RNA polymerase sigma-70 factor (ECF subfamily)